ncbi:hypothetical protein [Bradyrhizobium sp. AS23.2]|uniref:hypothetical protein n=1 Tax=Bradyrhizobium sp. AS23.2 TaxID=1680155 RepID=UPI00093EC64B|nr:hypothetical protein [Bradyrhizobium sp. AS23.2]OKO83328.1 hypothetical protein AC630_11620 [Bradyrhizobium sp. AS23.2]
MERYIHSENIALFKRRLADPKTTDSERKTIQKLLAEEEANEAQGRIARTNQANRTPCVTAHLSTKSPGTSLPNIF